VNGSQVAKVDPTHSHASFSIRVMSISTTRGRFKTLRGQLHIDEQNSGNSWVEAEVDAASIDTHNKLRDAHLRSAGFFAVKQYPTIVIQSTNVEHTGGQDYQVTGNLTLHGVTKPITFDVQYRGQNTKLDMRTSLIAKAKINRNDFGLGRGMAIQFAASELATIKIDLEAVQKPVEVREAVATAE
jgi:polyisoprenoid-binding protein YceI